MVCNTNIKLTKVGYNDSIKSVTATPGGTQTVQFPMVRSPSDGIIIVSDIEISTISITKLYESSTPQQYTWIRGAPIIPTYTGNIKITCTHKDSTYMNSFFTINYDNTRSITIYNRPTKILFSDSPTYIRDWKYIILQDPRYEPVSNTFIENLTFNSNLFSIFKEEWPDQTFTYDPDPTGKYILWNYNGKTYLKSETTGYIIIVFGNDTRFATPYISGSLVLTSYVINNIRYIEFDEYDLTLFWHEFLHLRGVNNQDHCPGIYQEFCNWLRTSKYSQNAEIKRMLDAGNCVTELNTCQGCAGGPNTPTYTCNNYIIHEFELYLDIYLTKKYFGDLMKR